MITTVGQFIDELGGTSATAKVFETGMTSVSNWRKRNRFPPWAKMRGLDIARANKMRFDPRLFAIVRTSPPKIETAAQAAE